MNAASAAMFLVVGEAGNDRRRPTWHAGLPKRFSVGQDALRIDASGARCRSRSMSLRSNSTISTNGSTASK